MLQAHAPSTPSSPHPRPHSSLALSKANFSAVFTLSPLPRSETHPATSTFSPHWSHRPPPPFPQSLSSSILLLFLAHHFNAILPLGCLCSVILSGLSLYSWPCLIYSPIGPRTPPLACLMLQTVKKKKKKKGKKYCLKDIIPSQSSPKQLSNCSRRALN